MINNNVMTMKEAAAYLGLEYETFRYYVKKMRGPDCSKRGKIRLFDRKDLDSWKIEDRRCGPRH